MTKIVVGLMFGAVIVLAMSSTACSVTVTQTGCVSDLDCAAGDYCDSSGYCISGGCVTDADCYVGDICDSTGSCIHNTCSTDGSKCFSDSECCTGVCSLGDDTCGCVITNSTGCAADSDCCSTADACINGICQ